MYRELYYSRPILEMEFRHLHFLNFVFIAGEIFYVIFILKVPLLFVFLKFFSIMPAQLFKRRFGRSSECISKFSGTKLRPRGETFGLNIENQSFLQLPLIS